MVGLQFELSMHNPVLPLWHGARLQDTLFELARAVLLTENVHTVPLHAHGVVPTRWRQ
jgi:hypothetical protein